MLKGGIRNLVDQAIFDGFGGEPDFLVHHQSELAKDFALAHAVIQLTGAAENLHGAAADIVEPMIGLAEFKYLGAGAVVDHLNTADNSFKKFFRHVIER